jgi:hypothetical protein
MVGQTFNEIIRLKHKCFVDAKLFTPFDEPLSQNTIQGSKLCLENTCIAKDFEKK